MDGQQGRDAGARLIALVGPFGSGKTSLLEAVLARTGAISRQGRVSEANTVGDGSPEARATAMSIEANIAEAAFMGDRYTFIDCPGSVEFQHEAAPVLAAADLAIVVTEADPKKVAALQLVLRDLEARRLPHVLFINKIDKLTGDIHELLSLLQPASSSRLVLRQIPLMVGEEVEGFIDLAMERAHIFRERSESETVAIPDGEVPRELKERMAMLEQVADFDDVLMEQLLEDVVPARTLVLADLTREMREGQIVPVFLGAAEHGNGISRLLKALRHEAPTIAETRARLGLPADAPAAAQVLKTLYSPGAGKLSVVRVLSGSLADQQQLITPDGRETKVSGLFSITGQDAHKRGPAAAGDTVGLGKLDGAPTGSTLHLAARGGNAQPQLAPLPASEPVMALAISPKAHKDDVRLSTALAKLAEEDPSLHVAQVAETGETVLEGQGEMHLRVSIDRLNSKYGVPVTTGPRRIGYRETIRRPVTQRGRHKKQSGGHGQFGDVVLDIKPLPRGSGIQFTESITGGVVPRQYFSSVEIGVRDYLTASGPLGFPVVDVAVNLSDGTYHTVDSSDMAFRQAAQIAMREGMPTADPVLLEPVVELAVYCPQSATAQINTLLSRRRGQLLGSDPREGWSGWDQVRAMVPEAETADLIIELRSITAGVGTFTQRFDHFAELSGRTAEEIVSRYGRESAMRAAG